jgi:hypothetical protein
VGRLGQAILTFFSWWSFADFATASMESVPATYKSFSSLFLEKSPSIVSVSRFTWSFITSQEAQPRVATTIIIFNMLFVLAWPTLTSVMTGYTPVVDAFILDTENNFVRFAEFQLLAYIIHDASRIGQIDELPIPLVTAADNSGK